ncbi:predicted protein [Naegleria gruberi]|uniref:Predicted protein n=1 Tax=Naegleria gruberi TaxID=5762 RepID=D2VLU5_NAEGR|nr:uncharacterized protein NAEGRDRAFT_69903 [Naegleria gruberi]EFC42116.1 predicted protein [Naegleria gruberi]|eukprot:XP_002674860.1 predicted protein [Naegleria gruberi strain NEG-M]
MAAPEKQFNWRIIKHVLVLLFWFINTGVFAYYIYSQAVSFIKTEQSPVTSTSYSYEDPLNYPTITICDWSRESSFAATCPVCTFEYISCYWYNYADDTNNPVACPLTFTFFKDGQSCFEANADISKLLTAKKKGYLGSINMLFRIPINYTDPLLSAYRLGASITFREPGTLLGSIFAETNYAIPGRYNLFSIKKVVYEKLPKPQTTSIDEIPLPTTDSSTKTISYEATYSALKRVKTADMTDNDYLEQIEVAFTYEELKTTTITEIQQKDGWSLFGEVAGMAGLLLGLDILKSFRLFLMFPRLFFRQTSLGKIWEAMN